MKYLHYDKKTQKLLGWYDDKIHNDIPNPNIEVSDENWQKAIDTNANYVDVKNKTVSFKDFRTLDDFKTLKTIDINSACSEAITSGFTSDALGGAHIYQSEQPDQLNLIGLVAAGTDDYFKCGITDANGNITWNYELHTIVQLQQVLADGKVHKQGLLQKANTLKAQVAVATTVKDVEAVVW